MLLKHHLKQNEVFGSLNGFKHNLRAGLDQKMISCVKKVLFFVILGSFKWLF